MNDASLTPSRVARRPRSGSVDNPETLAVMFHGKIVRLSGQRGRVVLLTFLYTRCPDVCPLLAANLNAVLRSLGAKSDAGWAKRAVR